MINDLKLAFRQLAKAPGFTAIIVLTLALGIGACTAIYSALDSVVLNPYDDPATERNIFLRSVKLAQGVESGLSVSDFLDLEKQATSFEFMAYDAWGRVTLTGTDEPQRLTRSLVTPRYFDIFGITLALGRPFLPDEYMAGRDNVLVLSHDCWQRTFGGVPDIVGRTLQIDDKPHTVVGVISKRFERRGYFSNIMVPRATNVSPHPNDRGRRTDLVTTARLRRGVTIEQAQRELDVIAAALAENHPVTNKGYGFLIYKRGIIGSERRVIPYVPILFGAALSLLAIACANIAGLLLMRANARQREISVRAALGASRGRLIRQLLTESLLLALLGGAAGVLLAQWALDFIRSFVPSRGLIGLTGLARFSHLELDGGVLAWAVGLSFATALVFGLAPAWLSTSTDLNAALRQGTRGSTEGRSRSRFRAVLVVGEIVLAFTLLAGTGLLIRSFLRVTAYDLGFDPQRRAFVRVQLSGPNYDQPEQRIAFTKDLLSRVRSAVEVEAVGVTNFFPVNAPPGPAGGFEIEGGPSMADAERPVARRYFVSADYFRAMGIRLKQGRTFSEHDEAQGRQVAIINQTLARLHFPNQNPIGQRIRIVGDAWREIVGVVGDVVQNYVGEAQPAQLYEPHAHQSNLIVVVVRGYGNPALLPATVNNQIRTLDPSLPLGESGTVEEFVRNGLTLQRLTLHLFIAFAAIGLLIAAIGIYGVIAFSVSQRTAEIGIRMALGAQSKDVLQMILRQGARLVGGGLVLGVITTFVAGRAIESRLYNTSGNDPLTLIAITIVFSGVAALACWFPARRATKVDPIIALRSE